MARENEEGAFFCRDNHENYAAVVAIFLEASPDVDASTYHQEEMNNSRVTEFLFPRLWRDYLILSLPAIRCAHDDLNDTIPLFLTN